MKDAILKKLEEILPPGDILTDEPLSRHTGFRTGGPADFFVTVRDVDILKKIITIAIDEEITYFRERFESSGRGFRIQGDDNKTPART